VKKPSRGASKPGSPKRSPAEPRVRRREGPARAEALARLRSMDREIRRLVHVSALLSWDQETYMPYEAVGERSEQLELLSGLIHDRLAGRRMGELLAVAGAGASSPSGPEGLPPLERAFLRELYRVHRRASRLPRKLVTELAKQTAIGQARWAAARKASDFRLFSGQLAAILALVRESASCLGWEEHPYDPLLDEFEPWMKTAEVERLFAGLRDRLTALVQRIVGSRRKPDSSFLKASYDVARQREFSLRVLKAIGYDFQRGRLDESAHPFTTTVGQADVRLTTRYSRSFVTSGIFGTIHEAGHGLYELGMGGELAGTLLADGASMGMHESQSRMWENLIGRSLPFWRHFFPELAALFPEALEGIGAEEFYRGINAVEPSLIRVEADEVTYNLHILARFELEKRLIAGELSVEELPAAWNEQYRSLLAIAPPDDAQGVLQDIHWSMGSFGYFPTYTLGNLYAAQLFQALRRDLGDLDQHLLRGEFAPLLAWLRDKVHRFGRMIPASEMCRQATGRSLDPGCLLAYLEDKYAGIYEL
jgi:carboxypeptidase Taq